MEIRKTTMHVPGLALPVRRGEVQRAPATSTAEPDASHGAVPVSLRPLGSVDPALPRAEAIFTLRESRAYPHSEQKETFSHPVRKALDAYRMHQAFSSDDKARLSQLVGVDYYV